VSLPSAESVSKSSYHCRMSVCFVWPSKGDIETLSETYIDFKVLLVCGLAARVEGGCIGHGLVVFRSFEGFISCRSLEGTILGFGGTVGQISIGRRVVQIVV
jgi:hypothetical protein